MNVIGQTLAIVGNNRGTEELALVTGSSDSQVTWPIRCGQEMVLKSQTQLHLSALLRKELAGNYLAQEPRRGCHLGKVTGCLLSSHLSVWLSLAIRRLGRHTHSLLYQREPDWIQTNHRTVLSRAEEMVKKEKRKKTMPRWAKIVDRLMK